MRGGIDIVWTWKNLSFRTAFTDTVLFYKNIDLCISFNVKFHGEDLLEILNAARRWPNASDTPSEPSVCLLVRLEWNGAEWTRTESNGVE